MTSYNVLNILKKNKNLILISIFFFIIGGIAGFLSFEKMEGELVPILKNVVFAGIIEESRFKTALNILERNLSATAILLISGITIIVPIIIVFLNGYLFGFVFKLMLTKNLDMLIFVRGVLPHSIFEFPAFLISAAIGIRTGIIILSTGRNIMKTLLSHLKETAIIYVIVIIPLLLIAAFIEAFVSSALVLGY